MTINSYIGSNIDASRIKEQARKRARGDTQDKPEPTTTIIHYHSYGDRCDGREHETHEAEQ